MRALALDTCRDVFIGDPLNRGISGEQHTIKLSCCDSTRSLQVSWLGSSAQA